MNDKELFIDLLSQSKKCSATDISIVEGPIRHNSIEGGKPTVWLDGKAKVKDGNVTCNSFNLTIRGLE
jgi:hypothetical protein